MMSLKYKGKNKFWITRFSFSSNESKESIDIHLNLENEIEIVLENQMIPKCVEPKILLKDFLAPLFSTHRLV